jgi:spore maturation protein CgeB
LPENKKTIDVIYVGNAPFEYLNKIQWDNKKNVLIGKVNPKATRGFVSYVEKLNLISMSKISICTNEYVLNGDALNFLKNFSNINDILEIRNNKLTQHKSRVIEAAFCRSIILCKSDEFNIIEDIFDVKKEFIYFDDSNLKEIINEILSNYDKYKIIADNAYNRAINNYTTKHFYNKYIL